MPIEDPIEPSVPLQLQTEKLKRTIENCQDLDLLKEIAKELLKLHQNKSAIAQWATKRAAEGEQGFYNYAKGLDNENRSEEK